MIPVDMKIVNNCSNKRHITIFFLFNAELIMLSKKYIVHLKNVKAREYVNYLDIAYT